MNKNFRMWLRCEREPKQYDSESLAEEAWVERGHRANKEIDSLKAKLCILAAEVDVYRKEQTRNKGRTYVGFSKRSL